MSNQEAGTLSNVDGQRRNQEGGTRLEVYRRLAEVEGEGAVLEVPWFWFWNTSYAIPLAQEIHRRDVVVGLEFPAVTHPSTDFRNTVSPQLGKMRNSRARFVVVHKDVAADEARVEAESWLARSRKPPGVVPQRLQRLGAHLTRRGKEVWGEPWYEDEAVAAWDLEALREAR